MERDVPEPIVSAIFESCEVQRRGKVVEKSERSGDEFGQHSSFFINILGN